MSILPVSALAIERTLHLLAQKKVVALPTETVYGLAGDAFEGEAIALIYNTKKRPIFNPLIAHVSSIDMVEDFADVDARAYNIMRRFWPGPLTLVLPLKPSGSLHKLATAGLDTVAVRQPQGVFSKIIDIYQRPLVAPSANRSGRLSPTTARAVADDLGDSVDLIVDGGPCSIGIESTIIKLGEEHDLLLRPGGLPPEQIELVTGRALKQYDQQDAIQAPGMLRSHYAPRAQLRLNAQDVRPSEALLAFGPTLPNADIAIRSLNLSPDGRLIEAAMHLFDYLKQLDELGVEKIAVQEIPKHGLGLAINDRLARAAAPRSSFGSPDCA